MFRYGFLHHTINTDFVNTTDALIEIISRYDINDELYSAIKERILQLKPTVKEIDREVQSSSLTPEIRLMIKERQEMMRSLQMMVNARKRLPKQSEQNINMLRHLLIWLSPYKKSFYHPRLDDHYGDVLSLELERQENQTVEKALIHFNLNTHFDRVVLLSEEINEYAILRLSESGETKKETLKWRKEIQGYLKDLFLWLELSIKYKGKDDDICKTLAGQLQVVLKRNERIYLIKKGMLRAKKAREQS